MQVVNLVYLDKYYADIDDLREGRPAKSFRDYVAEWFLCKFGIKKFAEVMLRDFARSLAEYARDYDRFKLFAQFLGVYTGSGGKGAEMDRGDLRKAFFLSPDVGFAALRLIYRLRSGCSPYLPVLQVKNASTSKLLEDLGNFVSLDKAKRAFTTFMGECGYAEERFVDFDNTIKYIADQEPKHVERFSALKEGADLKARLLSVTTIRVETHQLRRAVSLLHEPVHQCPYQGHRNSQGFLPDPRVRHRVYLRSLLVAIS